MRKTRLTFAALALFAAIAASPSAALAQQTGAPAPSGRIVVIDSGAFSDEKQGIARVAAAVKQVDAQFEAPRAELRRLTDQYNALVKEIQDTQKVANPQTLAQLSRRSRSRLSSCSSRSSASRRTGKPPTRNAWAKSSIRCSRTSPTP